MATSASTDIKHFSSGFVERTLLQRRHFVIRAEEMGHGHFVVVKEA